MSIRMILAAFIQNCKNSVINFFMVVAADRIIDNPVVSVVVMTYNHKPYIRRCINAIIAQQTTFPFEIIISDDNSVDGTQVVLKEYQNKYPSLITLLLQNTNKGVAQNFHDAISICRGQYIASMGGDDFWIVTSKLQLQKDYLDAHPLCGLCYTNINTCDEAERLIEARFMDNFSATHSFEEHLLSKGFIAPMTWMYRKDLIKYYDPKGAFSDESFAFALDALALSSVDYIDVVTTNYRQTYNSLSRPESDYKNYLQWLGVFRTQVYYADKYSVDPSIKQKILINGYIEFIPLAYSFGDNMFIEEANAFFESIGICIEPFLNTCRARQSAEMARKSLSYRIGHFLLKPFRLLKRSQKNYS